MGLVFPVDNSSVARVMNIYAHLRDLPSRYSRGKNYSGHMRISDLYSTVVDAFFPDACPGCGEKDFLCTHKHIRVCWPCLSRLAMYPQRVTSHLCTELPIFASGDYSGVLRRVIIGAKEKNSHQAELLCGVLLGNLLLALMQDGRIPDEGEIILVCAPSTVRADRSRNGNLLCRVTKHALILVSDIYPNVHLRMVYPCVKSKEHKDSVGQSKSQRITNAQRGYILRIREEELRALSLQEGYIVVVDDIHTTGATLYSFEQWLNGYGVRVQGGLTLAYVQ